jgi:type II secretory pathway predicted ATPase ExeA
MVGVRGIHEAIVTAFGAAPTNLSSRLVTQAAAALSAERDERGRTPVLVLDEAHLLGYEQLETIRMLTLCRGRGYAEAAAAVSGSSWQARGNPARYSA